MLVVPLPIRSLIEEHRRNGTARPGRAPMMTTSQKGDVKRYGEDLKAEIARLDMELRGLKQQLLDLSSICDHERQTNGKCKHCDQPVLAIMA